MQSVALGTPKETDTSVVLENLRQIKSGQIETYYFEAKEDGETIGYAIVSLRGATHDGHPVYKYKNESSVKVRDEGHLTLVSNATMQPNFEPISVEIGGTAVTPQGVRHAPKLTISVDSVENKIKVHVPQALIAKGSENQIQEYDRPSGAFIYATDAIVHLIDFKKYQAFRLAEYVPQNGDVLELKFRAEPQPDGTTLVTTTRADGESDYKFWLDKDGKLDRWGEPPYDLLLQRSSKAVVDKLKAEFEKKLKAAEAASPKKNEEPGKK